MSSNPNLEDHNHNPREDITEHNPEDITDHNPGEDITDHNPGEDITDHNPGEDITDHNPGEDITDHNPGEDITDHNPGEDITDHNPEEILLEYGSKMPIQERVLEGQLVPIKNVDWDKVINLIKDAATIYGFGTSGSPGGGGGSGGPPDPRGGGGDSSDNNNVTIDDVGGLDEQIMYLRSSVIFPMTHPDALKPWGVTLPKGLLFHGAPGTGKTLVAKAIANEIGKELKTRVPFYYHKGADCLNKYFGQSEENLRAIFRKAIANKPSILFFDEIDGLCPNRAIMGGRGGSEAYVSVVTAFLGLMDTIKNGDVLVIGATNLIETIDPAVRRPGRFDKEMIFHPPDEQGRIKIIQIHTKEWKIKSKPTDPLLKIIGSQTQGFTGAYLENLCKEALNAAIDRNMDDPSVDEGTSGFKGVVVLEKDWAVALNYMERPKTKSFGSNLHVAIKHPLTEPLLNNLSSALQRGVDKVSPADPVCQNKLNSMLVWDNVENSNYDIENFMIPDLLNQTAYQKVPVYELSVNNIANMSSVFQQVFRSADPCILYIPRINQLWDILQYKTKTDFSHLTFVLLNYLKMARGRPVLVLATSIIQPLNMSPELKEIFQNSFKMRKPNAEERDDFFKNYLREDWEDVKKLLDEIVRLTDGSNIQRLVNVHSWIHMIYQTQNEQAAVHEQMEEIVEKLRIGKL